MQDSELKQRVKALNDLSIFKTLCDKDKVLEAKECHICQGKVKKALSNNLWW